MAYILLTTKIRLVSPNPDCIPFVYVAQFQEAGPTRVGDSDSDGELMNFLEAEIRKEPGSP